MLTIQIIYSFFYFAQLCKRRTKVLNAKSPGGRWGTHGGGGRRQRPSPRHTNISVSFSSPQSSASSIYVASGWWGTFCSLFFYQLVLCSYSLFLFLVLIPFSYSFFSYSLFFIPCSYSLFLFLVLIPCSYLLFLSHVFIPLVFLHVLYCLLVFVLTVLLIVILLRVL